MTALLKKACVSLSRWPSEVAAAIVDTLQALVLSPLRIPPNPAHLVLKSRHQFLMLDAKGGSSKNAGALSRTIHDPEVPAKARTAGDPWSYLLRCWLLRCWPGQRQS